MSIEWWIVIWIIRFADKYITFKFSYLLIYTLCGGVTGKVEFRLRLDLTLVELCQCFKFKLWNNSANFSNHIKARYIYYYVWSFNLTDYCFRFLLKIIISLNVDLCGWVVFSNNTFRLMLGNYCAIFEKIKLFLTFKISPFVEEVRETVGLCCIFTFWHKY